MIKPWMLSACVVWTGCQLQLAAPESDEIDTETVGTDTEEPPRDEPEPEPEPEEPEPDPIGPDLGDVGFSVTWDILEGFADPRWSDHMTYVVEICFDGDDGGGVSAVNLGDERITDEFEVAIGLVRVDDGEVSVGDDLLWSDIVIAPGDPVTWSGPFCTSITSTVYDTDDREFHDPIDYALFVWVDVWDEVDEADDENNFAFSDPITLEPIAWSNF